MAGRSHYRSLGKELGRWGEPAALALVLLLSLPAAWPFLQPGWPDIYDQQFHLFRLIEFDNSFRHGILYPRWAPDLGLGHGIPLFNFVPPLAYYLAEGFHLLGADFAGSINLAFFAAFIMSPLALYAWARRALGSTVAAVAAALAYNYAPYHLIDGYQRGALPEALGFVFYPLVLWAIHGVVDGKRMSLPLGALALAGAILAHNVTALPFLLIALLYLGGLLFFGQVGRSGAPREWTSCLARAGLMIALGLALSAVYWLPALLEMPATQARTFVGGEGSMMLWHPLVEPIQVIQWSLTFDYDSVPYKVGLIQALMALIGLGTTLIRGPALARGPRRPLITSGLLFLLLIGLTSTLASPLWDRSGLMLYLQFAWRLLVFVALFGALLTGAIAFVSKRGPFPRPLGLGFAALSIALLAYASLAQQNNPRMPIAATDLSPETVLRWSFSWRSGGNIADHEFIPRWTESEPSGWYRQAPLPTVESLPPVDRVEVAEWGPQARRLTVEAQGATQLRFQTFYFPGWQAYLDGEAVPTFPSTKLGLATVDIPPGQHLVELLYQDTLPRCFGLVASGVGVFFLLVLIPRRPLRARLAFGALGLALLVGAVVATASILANSVPKDAPVPLDTELSSDLRLVGYRAGPLPQKGTPAVPLEIYWMVRSSFTEPLRPTLQLLDAQGRVVVSQEAEPTYGTNPPGVWQTNEVVRDRYQLFLPPGLSGGRYRLNFVVGISPRQAVELGEVSLPSLPQGHRFQEAFTPQLFGNLLYLSDYRIEDEAEGSTMPGLQAMASPGQRLKVTLFWQPKARLPQNYGFFVHLLDNNFNLIAQRDHMAWDVLVLPMGWLPGETISDEHLLALPQEMAPGLYQVLAGVYDYRGLARLPVAGQDGYLRLGWVKVRPSKTPSPQPQMKRAFEKGITLLGYDIHPPEPHPGEPVEVTLYWRAEAHPREDLTVFAHVLDSQGRLVAQHDGPPAAGSFPTWVWEEGDTIADAHQIRLPQDLAPGEYHLHVGLYDPATGKRLPTTDGEDAISLVQFSLLP